MPLARGGRPVRRTFTGTASRPVPSGAGLEPFRGPSGARRAVAGPIRGAWSLSAAVRVEPDDGVGIAALGAGVRAGHHRGTREPIDAVATGPRHVVGRDERDLLPDEERAAVEMERGRAAVECGLPDVTVVAGQCE